MEKQFRAKAGKQTLNTLVIMCLIVAILVIILFRKNPDMDIFIRQSIGTKFKVLLLDPQNGEKIVFFGDTYF